MYLVLTEDTILTVVYLPNRILNLPGKCAIERHSLKYYLDTTCALKFICLKLTFLKERQSYISHAFSDI